LTDPGIRRIAEADAVVAPMCAARLVARMSDDRTSNPRKDSMLIIVCIALALIVALLIASRFVTVDEVFLSGPQEPTTEHM
jgi:hypothetical protein